MSGELIQQKIDEIKDAMKLNDRQVKDLLRKFCSTEEAEVDQMFSDFIKSK